jgi:hypothetical protein
MALRNLRILYTFVAKIDLNVVQNTRASIFRFFLWFWAFQKDFGNILPSFEKKKHQRFL